MVSYIRGAWTRATTRNRERRISRKWLLLLAIGLGCIVGLGRAEEGQANGIWTPIATTREGVIWALHTMWDFAKSAILDAAGAVMDEVPDPWSLVPGGAQDLWNTIGPYLAAANYWCPIAEAVGIIAAVWAAIVAQVLVKFVIELIPGT
jgi:hypothetical protein